MLNQKLIKEVNNLDFKFPVAQLSRDLSMSKATVSNYLNGRIKASKKFILKVSNFYNIEISKLMEDISTEVAKTTVDDEVLSFEEIEIIRKGVMQHEEELLQDAVFSKWLKLKLSQKETEMLREFVNNKRSN